MFHFRLWDEVLRHKPLQEFCTVSSVDGYEGPIC